MVFLFTFFAVSYVLQSSGILSDQKPITLWRDEALAEDVIPQPAIECGRDFGTRLMTAGMFLYAATCSFAISAAQISLGIAMIGTLVRFYKGVARPRFSGMELAFGCFMIAGFFSVLNAENMGRASKDMREYLIYLVFYIPFWASPDRGLQRKLIKTMLVFGVLSAVTGAIRLIYWDDQHCFRIWGFFSMPMTFGEIMALLAILSAVMIAGPEKQSRTRILLLLSFFLTAAGVLGSFTRGAWIAFAAALALVFFRHPRRLAPVLLLVISGLLFGMSISSDVRARLESFNLHSNFFRFRIWQIGLEMTAQNPVFGIGLRHVRLTYPRYVKRFDIERNVIHGHLHNSFNHFLASKGIVGLIAFFWVWVQFFKLSRKAARSADDKWQRHAARGIAPLAVCFLASALTEHSYGDEEVAMLIFFLCGLLASPYRHELRVAGITFEGGAGDGYASEHQKCANQNFGVGVHCRQGKSQLQS